MHQQELNIVDVADKESLVAGGGHVTGLLVRAEADLLHLLDFTSVSQNVQIWISRETYRRQDLLAPEQIGRAHV